jgi:hypothetical protein
VVSGVAEHSDCSVCGVTLRGRWCHDCGRDSRPPPRSARDLLEDLFDNVFSFTAALPMTARALVLRPSLTPRAQRDGDRIRFLSPVKLYVTASVIFFLFLGLTGISFIQVAVVRTGEGPPVVRGGELPKIENFRLEERWLHPGRAAPRDPDVVAAFDRAAASYPDEVTAAYMHFVRRIADDPSVVNQTIATWGPRALWLMMPLHALLLWPLFRRGRYLAEHLILALWAHTVIFLALIAGALWNFTGLGLGVAVALGLYQVYFTAGLRGYYDTSWRAAVLKGAVHSFAYIGLLWLPLTAAFFIAQAMSGLPASYWET